MGNQKRKRMSEKSDPITMSESSDPTDPITLQAVFEDYKGRQAAIIRALTSDFEEFHKQCDPKKQQELCLNGRPDGSWDVNPPEQDVPPELPEPVLGINYAREEMPENQWISYLAVQSDAWLVSVAFYIAARVGFDKAARKLLFSMMNELPTVSEAVRNAANKQQSDNKEMSNSQVPGKSMAGPQETFSNSHSKDEEVEDRKSYCGKCEQKYQDGEFWICCDTCDKWFHGKCVKVTPSKAESIEHYKCPPCDKVNKDST